LLDIEASIFSVFSPNESTTPANQTKYIDQNECHF
jgi:hypothetical protein